MSLFYPADILLPKAKYMEKWGVIACDQYSSELEYWQRVRAQVGEAPSTLHLILPEAELGSPEEAEKIEAVHETMMTYQQGEILQKYPDAYIYVERTLVSGAIRRGIVGCVDLEDYDFTANAKSAIRATEKTVEERIPPRLRVREGASLELPHVLVLCNDPGQTLLDPLTKEKENLPRLYSLDLMENGGHIEGYLVDGQAAAEFQSRLALYEAQTAEQQSGDGTAPLQLIVGDGNHSLATAKTAYERLKAAHPEEDLSRHPMRYALVELENIQDDSQEIEPIHRIIFDTEPEQLLTYLQNRAGGSKEDKPVTWYSEGKSGCLYLKTANGELALSVLQPLLDEYLKEHAGRIDYIHGDDTVIQMAEQPKAIALMLPPLEKEALFQGVLKGGTLPRKTFSMGHACEKRYYMEARKIEE